MWSGDEITDVEIDSFMEIITHHLEMVDHYDRYCTLMG